MLRIKQLLVLLMLLSANVAYALPKNIQLEYEVTRDGKPFATVKESFTQDGKQYQIQSVTKGIGFYALFGERKLISAGEVTTEGLKPLHFELHQGDNPKKSLITDFDWPKSTLNMLVKGKLKTTALENGTQDLASYVYQFMFTPPQKNEINIALTTGKKLNQYVYKIVARGFALKVGGKEYKTTHIVSATTDAKDKKELWLAEEHSYIPLRYLLIDEKGANLEQTLTKIHVE